MAVRMSPVVEERIPRDAEACLPVHLVRRWLPAGRGEATHQHAFVELCHVQSGRGVLTLGARRAVAPAQTVAVLAPGEPHALAADPDRTCGANLLQFEPDVLPTPETRRALEDLLRLARRGAPPASLRGAGQPLAAMIVRVGGLARRADAGTSCRAALGELCTLLLRSMRDGQRPARGPSGRARQPASPRPGMDQVLEYIDSHLTHSISREELARQASFAPSYFSAIFHETTGASIPEYINARRVHRAQELLRDPDTRVSSVCYAVGFRDLSNFNRVFKRIAGTTPREFRRCVLGDPDDAAAPDHVGGEEAED